MNAFLRINLFLLLILFFGASAPKPKASLIPPGFVLMKAKDSIRSFLISENPVSNFDYLLYQEWLKNVFTDYPEVHLNSLLKDYDTDVENPFNDPAVTSYLGHPAFANYPVLGATWIQAMDYCDWKNDRFNEAICKALEGLSSEPNRSDFMGENNFNTEAFLNGQFAFNERFGKKTKYYNYSDNNKYHNQVPNNGALYPFFLYGCRLPTEQEWEYYQSTNLQAEPSLKEESLVKYAEYFGVNKEMIGEYKGKNVFTSKGNQDYYEWMLDIYSTNKKSYSNYMEVFEKNGFFLTRMQNGLLDEYGAVQEKDSLGTLRYRIMGWNVGGDAIITHKYGRWVRAYSNHVVKRDSNFTKDVIRIYHKLGLDSWRKNYSPYQVAKLINEEGTFYNGVFTVFIGGVEHRTNLPTLYLANRWKPLQGTIILQGELGDIEYLTTTAEFIYITMDSCFGCYPTGTIERTVVSNGKRTKCQENKGRANTGFRIVIPYYGNALPEPIGW